MKGLILNEKYQAIPSTEVMIDNRRPTVKVTSLGEFWRILLPGTYTLKVNAYFFPGFCTNFRVEKVTPLCITSNHNYRVILSTLKYESITLTLVGIIRNLCIKYMIDRCMYGKVIFLL